MTTYLITGGAGYVAASLVRLIRADGNRVRRLFRPGKRPLPLGDGDTIVDIESDLNDPARIVTALRDADVVLHLAAQTSVYVAEADPVADVDRNLRPLLRLLEACRALDSRPAFIFASTATVSGIAPPLPVNESTPVDPLTIYDLHKLAGESYVRHYSRLGVVRGASLRLANVYGPGPKSSSADRGVLNAMTRRALAGDELTIYGSGEYLRDYVYVEDVARAFLCAARSADALDGRPFLLGTGRGTTLADAIRLVAELVAKRTGRTVAIKHIAPPAALSPIETRNFVADPEALWQASGFRAEVTLATGIERTIDYFCTSEGAA